MSTENKIYNAEDLYRYHTGEMTPVEMNALERAALNDPFLQEALEGYAHSKEPTQEVSDIQLRLASRVTQKENKSQKGLWLKIAAIFIVMAGLGYFIYQGNDKTVSKQFAKNESALPSAYDNDSTDVIGRAQPPVMDSVEKTLPESQKQIISSSSHQNKKPPQVQKEKRVATDDQKGEKGFVVQGKVTDEIGNALVNAKVIDPVKNVFTTTDSDGNFSMMTADKNVAAEISSRGYQNKTAVLQAGNEKTVTLEKDIDARTRILETANNAAKKRSALPRTTDSVPADTTYPSGGMENYSRYLKQSISSVYDESGIKYSGKVSLQFYLDENGKPENITIKKSLCNSCDLQAIQLLKNGVTWIGAENTRYDLDVEF